MDHLFLGPQSDAPVPAVRTWDQPKDGIITFYFNLHGCPSIEVTLDHGSDELDVLQMLVSAYEPITLSRLCTIFKNYGSDVTSHLASARNMRRVIRSLREMSVPIIGSTHGLSIAKSKEEVVRYCEWLHHKAKADIKSMIWLKKQLLSSVNARAGLFDNLLS